MKDFLRISIFDVILFGMYMAIASVGIQLGWSVLQLAGVLVVATIGLGLVWLVAMRLRMGWYRRAARQLKRIRQGQSEAVIAELGPLYEAGQLAPELMLPLAEAYCFSGKGEAAEPIGRYVLAHLGMDGTLQKTDQGSRMFSELAVLVLSDALASQGKFIESAQLLRSAVPSATRPNFMTAVAAQYFYMGGELYNAQATLAAVQPMGIPFWNRTVQKLIPPKYKFMTDFLRGRLMGEDVRGAMRKNRKQFGEWEKEWQRHPETPYGVRLGEVLEEMQAVMGEPLSPRPPFPTA